MHQDSTFMTACISLWQQAVSYSGYSRKRYAGVEMDEWNSLPNFNLPAIESKMIVCGDTVFKVKTRPFSKSSYAWFILNDAHHSYLYRETGNNNGAQFKHENVQKDLKVVCRCYSQDKDCLY